MKKIIVTTLGLMLGVTFSAEAMTLGDVVQQYQVYKNEPAVLGATNPGTMPESSLSSSEGAVLLKGLKYAAQSDAIISGTLKVGTTNEEVKKLQLFLIAKGYLNADPTGKYGSLTQAAVRKFQLAQGIKSDGSIVGPATKAAITKVVVAETAQ